MRQATSIESLLCSPTGWSNGPIEPPDDTLLKPAPLLVVLVSVWDIDNTIQVLYSTTCYSFGCLLSSFQLSTPTSTTKIY